MRVESSPNWRVGGSIAGPDRSCSNINFPKGIDEVVVYWGDCSSGDERSICYTEVGGSILCPSGPYVKVSLGRTVVDRLAPCMEAAVISL